MALLFKKQQQKKQLQIKCIFFIKPTLLDMLLNSGARHFFYFKFF